MFWSIVGIIIGLSLALAAWSDLRQRRRSGRSAQISDERVSAGVRVARARASAHRRRLRQRW